VCGPVFRSLRARVVPVIANGSISSGIVETRGNGTVFYMEIENCSSDDSVGNIFRLAKMVDVPQANYMRANCRRRDEPHRGRRIERISVFRWITDNSDWIRYRRTCTWYVLNADIDGADA